MYTYTHTHTHTLLGHSGLCWMSPRQRRSVLSSPQPSLSRRSEPRLQSGADLPPPILLPILPDTHLPHRVNTETERRRNEKWLCDWKSEWWQDGDRKKQRTHTDSGERWGRLLWGNLPANLDLSLRLVKIIVVSQAGRRTKANMSPQMRGWGNGGARKRRDDTNAQRCLLAGGSRWHTRTHHYTLCFFEFLWPQQYNRSKDDRRWS